MGKNVLLPSQNQKLGNKRDSADYTASAGHTLSKK